MVYPCQDSVLESGPLSGRSADVLASYTGLGCAGEGNGNFSSLEGDFPELGSSLVPCENQFVPLADNVVEIHEAVVAAGVYNFQGPRIPFKS